MPSASPRGSPTVWPDHSGATRTGQRDETHRGQRRGRRVSAPSPAGDRARSRSKPRSPSHGLRRPARLQWQQVRRMFCNGGSCSVGSHMPAMLTKRRAVHQDHSQPPDTTRSHRSASGQKATVAFAGPCLSDPDLEDMWRSAIPDEARSTEHSTSPIPA